MRGIIHFGMPKTGSSSIQDTFHKVQIPDFRYFDWTGANHSSLLAGIVEDGNSPFIQKSTPERVRRQVANWQRRFEDGVARNPVGNIIFSAERLYRSSLNKKHALKAFLDRYCDSYLVIGYVRAPGSFLQSGFQQNVKTGLDQFRVKGAWPRYKHHISDLDTVFGAENVMVRLFDRAHLHNGDVVQDFAQAIGADLDPADIVTANESLSLESLALLFTERVHGDGVDKMDRKSLTSNRRLVARLAAVKGRKFAFDTAMIDALIAENSEDIAWIEERVGTRFPATATPAGSMIGSAKDLFAHAREAQPVLDEQITRAAAEYTAETPQDIVRFLDAFVTGSTHMAKPRGG
jgi:hypothetical protein